ncbi:MAG TPA: peptidoglycan DD-metalloendopeptidase family protein [Chloroflexota bacterium]|nr:peptidoglycan DD-metalloendopeptidase family protein [Chloroflexota bacterium]
MPGNNLPQRRRGAEKKNPRLAAFICVLFLALLAACQGQPVAAVVNVELVSTAVPPTSAPTHTALPPVQMQIISPTAPAETAVSAAMPSFTLPDPTQPPALTPSPAQPGLITPSPDHPDTPTPTPTLPPPTFTPPALPQTAPEEHYWLRRPVAEGGIVWTNKHYPYGSTRGGELRPHHGVEFDVPYNTEILATASGTVIVAGNDATTTYGPHNSFYGNLVVIQHDFLYNGQPVFTLYGHLSRPLVEVGRQVNAGDVIGLSGATGVADGPHMHFEVRLGQNSYEATHNPLLWLWPFPDRGTVVGRITFANGALAYEAPVRVERIDAPSRYAATTTYANETLNADDVWNENFALDDVEVGYYRVTVSVGDKKFTQEIWVYPRRTSFVEIVIEP